MIPNPPKSVLKAWIEELKRESAMNSYVVGLDGKHRYFRTHNPTGDPMDSRSWVKTTVDLSGKQQTTINLLRQPDGSFGMEKRDEEKIPARRAT
jgi:hypothetical protein